MASNAKLGRGTQLQVETATPGVYATIPEVSNATGPNITGAQSEVSNFDSPGRTKEFIPGLVDPGTISFTVNWDPTHALHNQLMDDIILAGSGTNVTRNYRLRFPQYTPARLLSFAGFVNSAPITIPDASQMTQNVDIQISGTITRSSE